MKTILLKYLKSKDDYRGIAQDILENKRLKTRISEEISDIFIYLISLVNNLELDLTTIFLDKMNKNSVKYPLNKFNSGKYEKV
jgi:hypothetical protein